MRLAVVFCWPELFLIHTPEAVLMFLPIIGSALQDRFSGPYLVDWKFSSPIHTAVWMRGILCKLCAFASV